MSTIKKIINILWQRHSINFILLLFMASGMMINSLMLVLTHERIPSQLKPLPDIGFEILIRNNNLIVFTELYITLQNLSFLFVLLFHWERERIFRRFTFVTGLAYMIRSMYFPSTSLPPSIFNSCSPKFPANITVSEYSIRSINRMIAFSKTFGFVTQQKFNLCGDQIFSGHTIIIIMVHLFIDTYYYSLALNTDIIKCAMIILKIIHWILSTSAIISLIISHQHYTIDIIISVYVCTQLFWTYHSLCMERRFFRQLKQRYHHHQQQRQHRQHRSDGRSKNLINYLINFNIDDSDSNFI
uniref:Phosphatidylcholine:ceramide cholinephosphotransferase 1-like n=1 Tax=Dermatophagoides pteronyssinus TaxID=6956 RepID=A0A6P6YKP5_DERPT|nr:phosphatidylcholine:ceramide cholinephosphotransferase 1-like [Dermatophagoides pteronyssinus]